MKLIHNAIADGGSVEYASAPENVSATGGLALFYDGGSSDCGAVAHRPAGPGYCHLHSSYSDGKLNAVSHNNPLLAESESEVPVMRQPAGHSVWKTDSA